MVLNILIIKLGALGDIVRTLPLIKAIKEKYPDSNITWITKSDSKEIIETNPLINEVLTLNEIQTKNKLKNKEFDILYNFDIEKEATKLASDIKAKKKLGFYEKDEFVQSFNMNSEYYLNTLFDDELKKSNKKTYQQMMFDAAELNYKKQHETIYLTKSDKQYAEDFVKENKIKSKNLIGIHLGAGKRWPSKAWAERQLIDFIMKAKKKGYEIILFGGKEDKEKHSKLLSVLKEKGIIVYKNDPNNTIRQFASLVNLCKAMICSDSLAIHVALAFKKPTIGLFFCTSPNEIESYDLLNKMVSPMLYDFFPEKMNLYDEKLVNSIFSHEVLEQLEKIAPYQNS